MLAISKCPEMIRLVLEHGANLLCVDNNGLTPLDLCHNNKIDSAFSIALIEAIPDHCASFVSLINNRRANFMKPQKGLYETLRLLKIIAGENDNLEKTARDCLSHAVKIICEHLNPLDMFLTDETFVSESACQCALDEIPSYVKTLLDMLGDQAVKNDFLKKTIGKIDERFEGLFEGTNPADELAQIFCETCSFHDIINAFSFISRRPRESGSYLKAEETLLKRAPYELKKRPQAISEDRAAIRLFLIALMQTDADLSQECLHGILGVVLRQDPVYAIALAENFWREMLQPLTLLIEEQQKELCALYATGVKDKVEEAHIRFIRLLSLAEKIYGDRKIGRLPTAPVYKALMDCFNAVPKKQQKKLVSRMTSKEKDFFLCHVAYGALLG